MSSPPSTPTPTSVKPTFTDKELRVLQHAWSCLKSPPEIDLEKLRVAAGFNTAKTTSNTWGVIKKKIAAVGGGENTPPPPPSIANKGAGKKGTPGKRKKIASAGAEKDGEGDEGEGEDEEVNETPAKKRKAAPKGKGKWRKKVADTAAAAADEETTEVVKQEEPEDDVF